MPKIRRSRKQPPDGWELIEPTLEELEQKMREGKYFFLFVFSKRLANDFCFGSSWFCLLTLR